MRREGAGGDGKVTEQSQFAPWFNDGRFRVTTEAKLRPLARFGCSTVWRLISAFSAVCSRVAYSDQERPWRSYLLPAGEGAPQGRMRDEMLALARKFPSSGRSGHLLPAGEGEDVPLRLQL